MRIAEDLREISEDLCFSGRKTLNDAADRLDMRAVVIVEFWAMMAGSMPYGWKAKSRHLKTKRRGRFVLWSECANAPTRTRRSYQDENCQDGWTMWEVRSLVRGDAWAAEYAARPRMES